MKSTHLMTTRKQRREYLPREMGEGIYIPWPTRTHPGARFTTNLLGISQSNKISISVTLANMSFYMIKETL